VVAAGVVVERGEVRQRRRRLGVARVRQQEPGGGRAGADQRHAAAPLGAFVLDRVCPRRACDRPWLAVLGVGPPELLDQRGERRLVVGDAVADESVFAGFVHKTVFHNMPKLSETEQCRSTSYPHRSCLTLATPRNRGRHATRTPAQARVVGAWLTRLA